MSQHNLFTKLVQQFLPDGTLLSASSLTGGISAQTTLLTVETDGEIQKFVVRQHGEVDRTYNPNIAQDEYSLLAFLYSSGIQCTTPYHVDETVFEHPCIVLAYIEGHTDISSGDISSAMKQMAEALAGVHSLNGIEEKLGYLPRQVYRFTNRLKRDDWDVSLREDDIQKALRPVYPLPQVNPVSLLHGDFWSGNVIWQHERLVAIIDWEDAMLGDPLADLSDARLANLWSFGRDAMQTFTAHYQTRVPDLDYRYLPYWDLLAALRPVSRFSDWATDKDHEALMRREHQWFVNQALAMLY